MDGQPQVLDMAAHSGTQAGCGDCVWTVVAACPQNDPRDLGNQTLCEAATHARGCKGGVLERLYLSDADVSYELENTVCLYQHHHVIPVGERAAADVARYLRNVRPPNLVVATRPAKATLTGLPTYFTARVPHDLRPAPFGGVPVTETITLAPVQSQWDFGDGSSTGTADWNGSAAEASHAYVHPGTAHGQLTARWGATYTITYAGQTFGPYTATGQLVRTQLFTLPVDTADPHLVSH